MPQRRHTALALVGAAALLAPVLVAGPALAVAPGGSMVFVDEVHYDNAGADTGEFVEIANPGGVDLAGWSVVLYNGSNGTSYATYPLLGTAAFTVVETPGIQNGSPDALALVRPGGSSGGPEHDVVEQLLSYEGVLTATDGPAAGLASTDLGVAETSSTPAGLSLQLTGPGATYGDGTWQEPAAETRGAANGGGGDDGGGPVEPAAVVAISAVQGSGAASPLAGQDVTVEAVVTTVITRQDASIGFFVQSRDVDADADPATSEGLYVFCDAVCSPSLAAGDLVRATGTVGELFGSTQLDVTAGLVAVTASGQPRPTPAVVTLPAATGTDQAATFQAQEGMLTTVTTRLALSEYFNLARFGQLGLTAQERPYQYSETTTPTEAGYQAYLADLATRRLLLDDGSDDQNDATSGPLDNEPYPFPTPGLSVDNTFRGGDTIIDLTGVMAYSFGQWQLRAVPGEDYTFTSVNPRPAAPSPVGGRLKVASVNVLNAFATIDETSSRSAGPCGPSGDLDCRGADSAAERERQRTKTTAELLGLDADVLGLVEVQNDAGRTTGEIVAALNAATAPGTYASLDTGTIGTDAIKVALVFKPAAVTPAGTYAVLDSTVDPAFVDTKNRPALVQTFDEVATGERFTVAVNHLKSKGSGCGAGDDATDGSGNCDGTRTAAAEALVRFLATDPTGSGDPDVLVIGDLNAYAAERPITALTDTGFSDLAKVYEGPTSYSYLFDGLLGSLDHALANRSLAAQVTGATVWHVNADESPLLDYNDDVQDLGESSFERESSALPLYAPDAFRSSDHDPLLVGLSLRTGAVVAPVVPKGRLLVTGLTDDAAQRVVQLQTGDAAGSRTVGARLSGFAGDTRLVGIDYRVANGLLYGLGDRGGLYTVDVGSGRVALSTRLTVALSGSAFGVDVDPVADVLRVVSDTGQNLVQPFAAGAATGVGASLTYGDGPALGVAGAAYTQNDTDPTTGSRLLLGDSVRDTIAEASSSGALTTLGRTRLPFDVMGDLDVYTSPSGRDVAYGVGRRGSADFRLVTLDLATGRARDLGLAPGVVDLAVPPVQP